MVKKAGTASVISSQSMHFTCPIIKPPTMIRTGEVATLGMMLKKGQNKSDVRNKSPITSAVTPVRPPSSIPAADSIYVVVVDVPIKDAKTVASASERKI